MSVVDLKFEQASDDLWAYASYSASDSLWLGLGSDGSQYAFRDAGDGPIWVPYTRHAGLSGFMEWSPWSDYSGDQWINPRGGRRLYFRIGVVGARCLFRTGCDQDDWAGNDGGNVGRRRRTGRLRGLYRSW